MKVKKCCLAALCCLVAAGPPAALHAQFNLSGRVTDPASQGVHPVDIDAVESQTGQPIILTGDSTNVNGDYSIQLWPATYDLSYNPQPSTGVAPVLLRSVPITGDTVIDVSAEWGMRVAGQVTDNAGIPLINLDVDVIDPQTGLTLQTPADQTDSSGVYSVVVPAGTYEFVFEPNWQDSLTVYHLWDVTVQADTIMSVTFPPSVDISGVVRMENGTRIANVDLDVTEATTGRRIRTNGDNTGFGGEYLIHLWPGVWDIDYEAPQGSGVADDVIYGLVVNGDRTIDITLKNGFEISGTITDILSRPIPNVDIDVDDVATGERLWTSHDNTRSDGTYSVMVPPGLYNIGFEHVISNVRAAPVRLDSVQVSASTVIDLVMPVADFISGTITDDGGAPVEGCEVLLLDSGTGRAVYTPSNLSDASGAYQLRVASGTYDIAFRPTRQSGVAGTTITGVTVGADVVQDVTLSRTFDQAIRLLPDPVAIYAGDVLTDVITLYNNDTVAHRVRVQVDALLPGGGTFPILPPYPANGLNLAPGREATGTLPISVPGGAPAGISVELQGLILDFDTGATLNADSTALRIVDPSNPTGH
jgi:hypothetical protein